MVPEAAPARSRWSSARVSVSERRMQAFLHHRLQPAEPHPVLPRAAASVQLPRARLHQSFLHEGIYLFIYVILYIFILLQFFIFLKIFSRLWWGKKKKSHHDTWEIFCETRYTCVITRNKTAWITFSLSKCLVVVVVCCWHAEMKTLCLLLVTAALILLLILLLITYKLLLVRTEYFSQLLL